MNLGQIYETVLGWAGKKLGKKFGTPIFDGATADEVAELLALSPFTVRPRVTELYKQDKIERKDKRKNASNRSAFVYVVSKAHINDMLTNKGV